MSNPREAIYMSDDDGDGMKEWVFESTSRNDLESLHSLLTSEKREEIANCQDSYGRTPLYIAVSESFLDITYLLLQAGADPNMPSGEKCKHMTPLHRAVLNDKKEFVDLLLENRADPRAVDGDGKTALELAIGEKHHDTVDILRKAIESQKRKAEELEEKLYEYLQLDDIDECTKIIKYLSPDRVADIINKPLGDERIYTFLHKQTTKCDLNFIEKLIKWGGEVLYNPHSQITILHVACQEKVNIEIIELLLTKFPDLVQMSTIDGSLPIHITCANGFSDATKLLLNFPYPSLSLSIFSDHSGIVKYSHAFNLNALNSNGITPLQLAVINSHLSNVKILLDFSVKVINFEEVKHKCLKLTNEYFCPIETTITDSNGLILLSVAIKHKIDYDIIKCLLEHGALLNATTINCGGIPPLMEAFNNKDLEVFNLLLEFDAKDEHNEVLRKAVNHMNSTLSTTGNIDQENVDTLNSKNVLSSLVIRFSNFDRETRLSKRTMLDSYHEFLSTDSDSYRTSKQQSVVHPIAINWHRLGLFWLQSSWFVDCAKRLNQSITRDSSALATITRIDLSSNNLLFLPERLFNLSSLKVLHLSNNHLTNLPCSKTSYDCSFLEDLDLSKNKLQKLPPQIFSLPNLMRLNVGNNCLENLPFELWVAPKLEELIASSNKLNNLPSEPENDDINFEDLPQSFLTVEEVNSKKFFCKESFQTINYWSSKIKVRNPIFDTDDSTLHLTNLDLSNNEFSLIPQCLPCLAPHLSKLNMSFNKLTNIGPLNRYPAYLRELNLGNNKIVEDESFCEEAEEDRCFSTNTGRLKLNHVQTKSPYRRSRICLHRTHSQMERLKMLNLAGNKLTKLVLVKDEAKIQKNVSRILSSSFKCTENILYPSLTVLDLTDNCLESIPPELSYHLGLSELKFSNNNIKELPSELGLLRRLWCLEMENCPVQKTLFATLGDKAKTVSILSYLKSIKEEATLYNRMKLMLVGTQGIGKTSLLHQLRNCGKYSPNQSTSWQERMGMNESKSVKGENLSTVGIDIGYLTFERNGKSVVFSTWDFGGQQEYYATHQYFLTKRSLYLVVWKLTDGEQGINDLNQWLVNIQARAPNSPVIIVGTHLDKFMPSIDPKKREVFLKTLRDEIKNRYMDTVEPEKFGLPRVVGHVELIASMKSGLPFKKRNAVEKLSNMIWDVVLEEHVPGMKHVKLIEQKIPASYIDLQDVVRAIAYERKRDKLDPVLHAEQYKPLVMEKLSEMRKRTFDDVSELNQATQFLHENGVILHYEDSNLQDIYFLDPQWLCDVLANIVTVREINRLSKCGIMKVSDIQVLFKNSAFKPHDIKIYVMDLLSKFEVALLWDNNNLLIPSLLPKEKDIQFDIPFTNIRIPLKGGIHQNARIVNDKENSDINISNKDDNCRPQNFGSTFNNIQSVCTEKLKAYGKENPAVSICRLYLMSYFPSGFWPRLITRLLADSSFYNIVKNIYPQELEQNIIDQLICTENGQLRQPEWKCWQTGIEIYYYGVMIARVKEVTSDSITMCDYRRCSVLIRPDSDVEWRAIDLSTRSILEIYIPNEFLHIGRWRTPIQSPGFDREFDEDIIRILQPNSQAIASLLSKLVDHIDTLLEDWYPDIGSRLVQNTHGMYLITRLIPCPRCLLSQVYQQREADSKDCWQLLTPTEHGHVTRPIFIQNRLSSWKVASSYSQSEDLTKDPIEPIVGSAPPIGTSEWLQTVVKNSANRVSSSYTKASMYLAGKESSVNKRYIYAHTCEQVIVMLHIGLTETECPYHGIISLYCQAESHVDLKLHLASQDLHCVHASQNGRIVYCPIHGNLGPTFIASNDGYVQSAHVASDVVFQDIPNEYRIDPNKMTREIFLGKGSFGNVYSGRVFDTKSNKEVDVAMKMLEPVDPGSNVSATIKRQYENDKKRWNKEPIKCACDAYLNARKELSILITLRHTNIVPLIGISIRPLCLCLSLAPRGSLNETLRSFKRAGSRLPVHAIRRIIMQTASALQYLHSCQIIYRDLKSENILVWSIPEPNNLINPVHVKLADYGVSRSILVSGTKGLAGTPPFIAPEIVKHNGEEQYTEKVDCFSFGMFLYELLALKQPFIEGYYTERAISANLNGHILTGGRPSLSPTDLNYPTHFLDLMALCWNQDPVDRPSAEVIVSIADSSEFSHVRNVVRLSDNCNTIVVACVAQLEDSEAFTEYNEVSQIWMSVITKDNSSEIWVATYEGYEGCGYRKWSVESKVCAICVANNHVWTGFINGYIRIYSQSTHKEMYSFCPDKSQACYSILYNVIENCIYVIYESGRIIVCKNYFKDENQKFSPILQIFPGIEQSTFCMAILVNENHESRLCSGQTEGRMCIWNLQGGDEVITYNHPEISNMKLITTKSPDGIWTNLESSTKIYKWNLRKKIIDITFDVSEYTEEQVQIINLSVITNYLYIGLSNGQLIITDTNLKKITTLTAFIHSPVQIILELIPQNDNEAILIIGNHYANIMDKFLSNASSYENAASKENIHLITLLSEFWRR